ncbi:helix-turn-helix domain-containing protein, partial [Micromonospora schwarzwaldensis]
IELEAVSRMAGMSYHYFSRYFKKTMGVPFTDYVNRKRIAAAERLLVTSGRSVGDIAVSVGIDNMAHFYELFRRSIALTFQYVLLAVPLRLFFALMVAMALNKGIRMLGIYRTVYYIPSLLGGSVAIAIVWRKMFDGDGLVNLFLKLFGVEGPSWIAHPDYVLYTIITLAVWQFGSAMVIFLA